MPTMHTIRTRHSVRQYESRPVEGETLRSIEKMIETARESSGLDIQLIQNNPEAFNVFASFGLIKGARTLIAFVADGRTQDRAIGYWGQRLVLELQDLGLNTCWAAIFSKRKCRAKVAGGKSIPGLRNHQRPRQAYQRGESGEPRGSRSCARMVFPGRGGSPACANWHEQAGLHRGAEARWTKHRGGVLWNGAFFH